MLDPLIIIIVAIAIIAIGLVISVLLSKDANQRRAVIAAFGSLVVIGALLYIVVVNLRGNGFFPFLVALCLLVPTGLYLGLIFLPSKKSTTAAKRPRHGTPTTQDAASRRQSASSNSASRMVVSRTRQDAAQKSPATLTSDELGAKPKVGTLPALSVLQTKPDLLSGLEPKEAFEPQPQAEVAAIPEPVAVQSSQLDIDPRPAMQTAPQPTVQVPLSPAPKVAAEPAVQPVTQAPLETAPKQDEQPTVELEPRLEAQLPETKKAEFDSYYAKAESFSQKGLFAIAGELFEESIHLTRELPLVHKAVFAAMNAYLQAGKKDDVKRLAVTVQGSGTLGPAQERRVAAILKMI
jgi:hypothetical protein